MGEDRRMEAQVREELGRWRSSRGPDLADLMRRAERRQAWQAPVAMASSVAAAALAVLFLLSLVLVAMAPAIPGGEAVRAHLLMAP
jgi:Flp pilus assembly protein TadB